MKVRHINIRIQVKEKERHKIGIPFTYQPFTFLNVFRKVTAQKKFDQFKDSI